ncbi:MAG: hypothetical protein ACLT9P_07740 [Evtepia gabavorous]
MAATAPGGAPPHRGASGRPGPSRIWVNLSGTGGYEGAETALAAPVGNICRENGL